MIKVTGLRANRLLTLPANETGFSALLNSLTDHRQFLEQEFNRAARTSVQNPDVCSLALMYMGQLNGLNEVIDLLEYQTSSEALL